NDKTARLWDAQTGKENASLKGHTGPVMSVSFSGDGTRVLTGSMDGTARVWDAQTGQEKVVFKGHTGGIVSVCFSPDGKRVLTGSGHLFKARQLIGGGDGTARLWDAETGKEQGRFEGHRGSVSSVCFSPDGKSALTAGGTTARLWDTETGKQKGLFEGPKELRKEKPKQKQEEKPHEIWGACFSPDGQSVVTISAEFPVQLFDAQTGQVKAV